MIDTKNFIETSDYPFSDVTSMSFFEISDGSSAELLPKSASSQSRLYAFSPFARTSANLGPLLKLFRGYYTWDM